jgi:RNA polymerase sigma-70 factor (ECF subfamily)
VLEKPAAFTGKSTLRTYVTGILKYKIIDALRAARREQAWDGDAADADLVDALFVANGHTVDMPRQWGDPDEVLAQKDFFRVLVVCLDKLPAQTARIFMMREWLELDTDEICRELGVSNANVWTVLYRARLRLRECLDLNWFGAAALP